MMRHVGLILEDGFTYNEIAEKLGITTKVVEYHISITLKALRFRLGTKDSARTLKLIKTNGQ